MRLLHNLCLMKCLEINSLADNIFTSVISFIQTISNVSYGREYSFGHDKKEKVQSPYVFSFAVFNTVFLVLSLLSS